MLNLTVDELSYNSRSSRNKLGVTISIRLSQMQHCCSLPPLPRLRGTLNAKRFWVLEDTLE